jgi:hypothetical protein
MEITVVQPALLAHTVLTLIWHQLFVHMEPFQAAQQPHALDVLMASYVVLEKLLLIQRHAQMDSFVIQEESWKVKTLICLALLDISQVQLEKNRD